jgi:hypothetical protein
MADDFIVEEESSNRTFIYAAIGMGAIFIIGLGIVVFLILSGRNGEQNAEIIAQNLTTEYENSLVTLTIAQQERVAAYTYTPSPVPPTPTLTRIATFTPSPTPVVEPTDVIQTPEPGTDEGDGPGLEEEATGEAGTGETDTAGSPTPTLGSAGGQLPASGMGIWGAIAAAASLVAVIVLARRFRPAA